MNPRFLQNTEQQSEWKHSQPLSTCATQSPSGRGPRSWRHGKRTAPRGRAQRAPSTWAPLTHRGAQISGMVFLRLNFIELTRFQILSICIKISTIALTDLLSWSLLNQLVCFMVVLCRFRSLNKKQVESARRLIDNGCFRRCPMMATLSGRAGIGFWWVSRAYRSVEKGLYPEIFHEIFLCFVSLDVRCCTYVVPRLVSILDPYFARVSYFKKDTEVAPECGGFLENWAAPGHIHIKLVPFAPMGILPTGWYSGILQEIIFQDDYQIRWF